jgi:hypothetical protein
MTTNNRLIQLWSLLVDSAHAQRVLTYAILEQMIGVPKQVVGCMLTAIQDYCNFHNLPPLTMLVVDEFEGLQNGDHPDSDIFGERARVYKFDWLTQKFSSVWYFQIATNKDADEMPWHGSWQPRFDFQKPVRSDMVWDN